MRFISRQKTILLGGAAVFAMATAMPAAAQEDGEEDTVRTMNTITVTTQKQAESLQDVPIAVSAFDPDALDRLNINTGQELQFNIPNFQSTQGNFSAGGIGIRGIRNAAVGASSDAAVGVHVNGVSSSGSRLLETELYDIERIEILRGPQGTLYGRNATGGVINGITAKPTGDFSASAELTYGDYNTQKATGHVELPIVDGEIGLRLAGYYLKRDGFSDALLFDGTTQDVDGRDLFAIRGTLGGDLGEKANVWVMFEHYEEDSSRTRSTKQLCTKDTRPFPFNQGCVPFAIDPATNPFGYVRDGNGNPVGLQPGFGTVNSAGTLGGVLAGSLGLLPFGLDPNLGNTTSRDLREFETNLVPEFVAERKEIQAQFSYDFDNNITATVLAGFSTDTREFSDDYNKGVASQTFAVVPGLTPDVDGDGDGDWPGIGAFGIPTPVPTRMRTPADVLLATDNSSSDVDSSSIEFRLQSDFDGQFNFTAGYLNLQADVETRYYVFFNTAEVLSVATGLPSDRSYFFSRTPYELDAQALFGEVYYDMNDDFKWTLGLRYTIDDKTQQDTPSLLLAPATVFPGEENGFAKAGPDLEASFEEVTGRFGFDWKLGEVGPANDTLLYAFYSRGYKGGGLNPPLSTELSNQGISQAFDPEFINAYEIGTKSTILDGAGALNLSAFYYDYEGYQISSIVNRTSVNQNVDATVTGFEAELYAELFDGFRVDATLGLLNSELADQDPLLDTYDQTGGDPNWVVVKNAASTQNCIADVATASALATSPFAAVAAAICDGPTAVRDTIFGIIDDPTTTADDAANLAFATSLQPEIRDGNLVDVSGNELPGSPDMTVSVGAQYTFGLGNSGWETTIRGDYYYQTEMFTRIFNLEADRIDSWSNANASISFDNVDKGWSFELYGKNLLEDDQITNQYLTDASSGLFTNVFLLEPKQFGVKVGKTW